MSRKVEFPEGQFALAATMQVASPRLRYAAEGGIVEDPQLLQQVTGLVAAAAKINPEALRFGEIRITEGAYSVDVLSSGVMDLTELGTSIDGLLKRFEEGTARLDANLASGKSQTAAQCGVSTVVLDVLKITSALKALEHPVQVATRDGRVREIAAPDSRAIVALAADRQHKVRKLDGVVQGIGRGDVRGSAVRLGKGTDFIVIGLPLDDAWAALRGGWRLEAIARWDNDAYVIAEGCYTFLKQGSFEFQNET